MDELKLYEGISHIDDDLIDEADVPARRPKYYTFALSAAAILLIIGVSGIAFGGNGKYSPHRYIESATTADSVTTSASPSAQDTVTACADTSTTRKVTATTRTTAVGRGGTISTEETSAKVTAVQETEKASGGTAVAAQTTAPVTKVTAAAASPSETLTQPVTTDADINEGSYDMKKISAFVTAITLTSSLLPTNILANASDNESIIMFTRNELYQFKCYANELSPDINGDGVFDICDAFELKLYSNRFCESFEKYDYDQSKYTELAELYSRSASERILECYNAEGVFTFLPVGKEGAEYLSRYYLYLNGSYPSDDEIYSSLENRKYFTSADDEDIAEFVRYINELRESIIYADDYEPENKYSDEQLEAFERFDNNDINADINRDSVVDFLDAYDVLVYSVLKNNRGQTAANNDYLSEETWLMIEQNGDVTLNGVVDEKDYELLMSYYCRNTIDPSFSRDDCINRIVEHIKKKNESTGYVDAKEIYNSFFADEADSLKGDANCDGNVSVADAVAVLQYIGSRDRYPLKEQGRKNADVNGDGSVTALDALEIQKMDAGISVAE